jgi:hypothetical protein
VLGRPSASSIPGPHRSNEITIEHRQATHETHRLTAQRERRRPGERISGQHHSTCAATSKTCTETPTTVVGRGAGLKCTSTYISSPKKNVVFRDKIEEKNGWGCSSSIFEDTKGNTDSRHAKSTFFDFKKGPPEKNDENTKNNISSQKKNVVFRDKIEEKDGWGYIPLYLMIKKEILKMSKSLGFRV